MKMTFFAVSLTALTLAAAAQSPDREGTPQNSPRRPTSLLERGAAASELPLSPWGPYSQAHSGPCFLADRMAGTLFAFPIVVGQRRLETVSRLVALPNGKTRRRDERVALERRLMGFSPAQAWDDDRPLTAGAANGWNRWTRLREADGSGLYWSANGTFAPAALSETALSAPDADGKITPPAPWSAGEATIACFPANVSPGGDGLLIRVSLTNRAAAAQTYFVDLLGGMDANSPDLSPEVAAIERDAETDGMMVKSKRANLVFALASNTTAFPQRSYRVGGAYFSPEGAVGLRSAEGTILPCGLLPDAAESHPEIADSREPKAAKIGGIWGLLRLDDITVPPGETVTLSLCVGLGKANADAADAAQALLAQCDDRMPDGARRKGDGLATKAASAHRAARFNSGSEAIDRLMAQSLTNTPETRFRRIGVASRRNTRNDPAGTYQTESGGWTALGWATYRQDWSAAQLNACFLTGGELAPPANPQATPPTNLFALWELYQKTHDRAMLTRFYPFAKRRYRELMTAGRVESARALFAWPDLAPRPDLTLVGMPISGPKAQSADFSFRAYAPDYSAYVIRAAKILRLMAEETKQPAAEMLQYGRDINAASAAMNDTLWDALRDTYAAKSVRGIPTPEKDDAEIGLLPLIAGGASLPPTRRAILIRRLSDPATFWSDAGIRSLSRAAPNYRAAIRFEGAVEFGQNWLLWKALLDAGEAETAQKLAKNLLRAYAAQSASYHCPEALDGDNGAGFGVSDFTGDACALIPLYQAYHTPGCVSSGWDVNLLSQHYSRENDTLRLGWHTLNTANSEPLLCVMGRPNGKYQLTGSLSGVATADANGLLTLTALPDATTQSLEITPVLK